MYGTMLQPTAMASTAVIHLGEWAQKSDLSTPSRAPPQTIQESRVPMLGGSASSATGVYVPAMRMKIEA